MRALLHRASRYDGVRDGGAVPLDGRAWECVGQFVYGQSYRAREDAVELDPVELRLSDGIYETARMDGFFGAIRDSMPDSWGRRVIERNAGLRQPAEFDYLMQGPDDRAEPLGFGVDIDPPLRANVQPDAAPCRTPTGGRCDHARARACRIRGRSSGAVAGAQHFDGCCPSQGGVGEDGERPDAAAQWQRRRRQEGLVLSTPRRRNPSCKRKARRGFARTVRPHVPQRGDLQP